MLKKILIISHDASRTGAPIGLLHFINWLKENNKAQFSIFLRNGGPLLADFRKVGKVYEFCPEKYHASNLFSKIAYRIYLKRLLRSLVADGYEMIYSNTMVNGNVIRFLKPLQLKVVTHIREMESTIEHFGGARAMREIDSMSNKFICVGHNVKEIIAADYKIELEKIEVVHEYIKPEIEFDISEKRVEIRNQLGISQETFVVGACGGVDWRKGYDYFVKLAAFYFESLKPDNVVFVWVGRLADKEKSQINFDLRRYGLLDKVIFTGVQSEPLEYFSTFDVFFLTSREEPGGLVSLEAGSLGLPVIVCENTGGVTEFVENDAGIIIPYLSIRYGQEAISRLLGDRDLRLAMGLAARQKVATRHSKDIASSNIFRILEETQNYC